MIAGSFVEQAFIHVFLTETQKVIVESPCWKLFKCQDEGTTKRRTLTRIDESSPVSYRS